VCPEQWLQTGGGTAGRRIQKLAYQVAQLKLLQRHYYRTSKSFNHKGHEGTQRKSGDLVIARDPVIGKAKAYR